MKDRPLLSRPIEVASIPPSGVSRDVVATADERAAIARAYGLLEVRALAAEFSLAAGAGIITVEGRVKAEIVQSCVITLVPVDQMIDEPITVRFVPAGSRRAPAPPKPGAELMLDAHVEEAPEVLEGPVIDLGALALEHFALAIDPYPRAPGATLPEEFAGPPAEAADSPFAVLAELQTKGRTKR